MHVLPTGPACLRVSSNTLEALFRFFQHAPLHCMWQAEARDANRLSLRAGEQAMDGTRSPRLNQTDSNFIMTR